MLSCLRIKSVEYYEKQAAKAGEDAKAAPHATGRDAVAYYTDNGQGEAAGVWWTRHAPAGDTESVLPSDSPFRYCLDGAEVQERVLRDLAAGRDPDTRKPLTKSAGNGKRSAGFDVQIAAPKSVSLLAAFGDEETRGKVFAAHDAAMRKALDYIYDQGLMDARRGKGGKARNGGPSELSAAVYRHFTSRAKDPQLHSHAVFMNLCVRSDGTTGSIDNATLMKWRGVVSALYRAELASNLRASLGVESVREGRNFEIAGIPEKLRDMFSKRRAQIEADMKARGLTTADNREAAQNASYQTRDAKDRETPLSELENRWLNEILAAGWTPDTLAQSTAVAAEKVRAEREAEEKGRSERLHALASNAIDKLTLTESVFTRSAFLRELVEAVQCECTANEALAFAKEIEESGRVVFVGQDQTTGADMFSTEAIIHAEKDMLRTAMEQRDRRDFVRADVLDRVLADRPTMSAEQARAVRHALNRDGISVVEGSAGAGKSFAMEAVKEAAERSGCEVHGIAPSWKAVDVLRNDTKLREEMARAVSGFVIKLGKGEIVLNDRSVVIMDEAGMVGTADMAAVVEAVAKAGGKLILTGDTRQLQPVVAGAPMAALGNALGTSRMDEIRRQKGGSEEEGKWMRAASIDFAIGDPVRALEAYDRAGAVTWSDDRDHLMTGLVSDYIATRMQAGDKPPTMAVLTAWNMDARAINDRIRAELRERGLLGGEITINAIPRGMEKAQEMALAKGDEIIFGETVEVGDTTIRNADIATVIAIQPGDDPRVRLRLAKGGEVTASLSQLVGYREEGAPRAPRIQHSYAMTVHASQGVTVDHAFVANLRGMGRESMYVAMTRHRIGARLYADTSRVRDALEARLPGVILTGKTGADMGEGNGPAEVSAAEVKAAIMAESKRSDRKANASDYAESVAAFVGLPGAETKAATPETPAATGIRPPFRPHPIRRPNQPLPPTSSSPPTAAQVLKDRMTARAQAPARYPVAKAPPRESRLIKDEERQQFLLANLIDLARDLLGGKILETWNSGRGAKVAIGGEKVAISFGDRKGIWMWTDVSDRTVKGVAWDLVARVTGQTAIQSQHWLRDKLRTWTPTPRPAAERERSDRPMRGSDEALTEIRQRWHRMRDQASRYLTHRGILPATWQAVRADVRAESEMPNAGNRGGVAFAHRNAEGEIVGYARRGFPKGEEGASWKGFSGGGTPHLWQSGERRNPTRIIITESAIDTLSKWQIEKQPSGVLLAATDGTPGRMALDTVRALARKHPEARWQIGTDNGPEGERFAQDIREAIEEAHPGAKIEDARPDPRFKDWNDALRGRDRETIEEEKRAERERQEAEARRLAEEAATTGPRLR